MTQRRSPVSRGAKSSRGMTLVELLVGLAIGLVISLVAAVAYLGSRGAATATESVSEINENGKFVLDMIGREIQMAGFYPSSSATTPATYLQSRGVFTNVRGSPTIGAFNQGLFGCDGAQFNPASNTCGTAVANAPDTVVINYFTDDNFGAGSLQGHGRDCNRVSVLTLSYNTDPSRVVTLPAGGTVSLPALISNRFTAIPTTYTAADLSVATKSLACNGNGNDANYQPIFQGVEDLVIRYGVYDGAAKTPTQFYTATQVNALPVDIQTNRTGWQRVSAVQVCVIMRTLRNARVRATGATETYQNCRGGTTNYNASDGTLYKRFAQTFAVRNALNGTN